MPDDVRDPRHHTQRLKARLQETIEHLREDIAKVDEPQLKAMFETSAISVIPTGAAAKRRRSGGTFHVLVDTREVPPLRACGAPVGMTDGG
ncbi:MAG: hypothetical protein JO339_22800 [Alphaproteobacteria bacterium]|nr:hypothetical protein [Alphaproteobacteria bacterium]